MKSYYDLLGVPPNAGAEDIKKAFRHEIAKYHPDKVTHLGAEFQEMAATRAAELTAAYKTLTDASSRELYDESLRAGIPDTVRTPPPPPTASAPGPAPDAPPPPPVDAPYEIPAEPRGRMFETERAGRDVILRRAMAERVQAVVAGLYGALQMPAVRGFDAAFVPLAKPRLLGTPPPRVLMRVVDLADAAVVHEAWSSAARARVHAGKSPVVVLLFGRRLAPAGELAKAIDVLGRQPRAADGPAEIAIVVIDAADLSTRLPAGASAAVRKLVDALKA